VVVVEKERVMSAIVVKSIMKKMRRRRMDSNS
jgi:hypothetical protein